MKIAIAILFAYVLSGLAQVATAQAPSSQLPPKEMFLAGVSTAHVAPTPADEMFQDQPTYEKKSIFKAAVYSLLLPGMGELYADSYDMGKYFTMAEGALWLTWGGFTSYGTWTQNDARAFAAQHAGIIADGHDDQYYIDIGNFLSADAYNQEILRERQQFKVYDIRSSKNWQWDNDNNRERYREMRVQSDETFNYARFTIATIITNHVISAINAGRLVISHNKNASEASRYIMHASVNGPTGRPDGMKLSIARTF